MGGWALVTSHRCAGSVGYVALVIGAVDVLAIPARREDNRGTDTARTWLVGELRSVGTIARSAVAAYDAVGLGKAAMAHGHGSGGLCAERWVTGKHTETLFKMLVSSSDVHFHSYLRS